MTKGPGARGQGPGYKRILIVRLDRIGDVVLSTPVIRAVREAYPESHIAVMVRPYAREIVEGNPYLNEVIIYDKEGGHSGIVGNLRFIQELKEKRFGLAIILHPTKRTHIVTSLAGIPERIGYNRKAGFLLTKSIPHTKQFGLKHEIDYALDILRYMGMEPKTRELYMPVNSVCERRAEELFKEHGIQAGDIVIAMNPGASCSSKRWSIEKFADVANRLVAKHHAKIVVVAGRADKKCGDALAARVAGDCLNLTGKTSVGDLASVLRRARLFISNDSGPVHIACAVNTPVIAIFGRSDRGLSPERWGPSGTRDVVLHKDAGCEICLAHNCRHGFRCLDSITSDEVVRAADEMLLQAVKTVETKKTFNT